TLDLLRERGDHEAVLHNSAGEGQPISRGVRDALDRARTLSPAVDGPFDRPSDVAGADDELLDMHSDRAAVVAGEPERIDHGEPLDETADVPETDDIFDCLRRAGLGGGAAIDQRAEPGLELPRRRDRHVDELEALNAAPGRGLPRGRDGAERPDP